MLVALLLAFGCFAIQMLRGASLLYGAFVACCVMLATATVVLYLIKLLAHIMARYLRMTKDNDNTAPESHRLGGQTESG